MTCDLRFVPAALLPYDGLLKQPPPQALRFSQGRGERLVMNRKGPWEGEVSLVVSFPPSFARTFSSTERETSGYEAVAEMYPDRMWTTPSSCFVLKFLQSSLIYLLFRLERSHYEREVDARLLN